MPVVDGIELKEFMKLEKQKWSQMSARQKWDYFRSYYLTTTIVILVVLIAAISFLRTYLTNGKEMICSGYYVNVIADESLYQKTGEGFFEYMQANPKKQQYEEIKEVVIDAREDSYNQQTYYMEMQIIAMISAQELDYMFLDDTFFKRQEPSGPFADLREVLPADLLEKYQDRLVYCQPEGEEAYPGAIDLTGTEFAEQYGLLPVFDDGKAYFALIVNSKRMETLPTFAEYLFQQ